MQQALAVGEERHKQHERRQQGDGEPEQEQVHDGQQRVGPAAVPEAHFQAHGAHAGRGRIRAAKGEGGVKDRNPLCQEGVEEPSQPKGEDPEDEDKDRGHAGQDGNGDGTVWATC